MCLGLFAASCSSESDGAASSSDGTPADSAADTDDSATDTDDSTAGIGGDGTKKAWTVLTFEIADTDLEPYMMNDVDEMGEVGTGANLNLISFVDRAAAYSSDPVLGLDDWVGGKLLEIEQGSATVLRDIGDVDTGDPSVLAGFIGEGFKNYPAEHYALIISDHGAAWPGVGGDESADGNGLDLAEIYQAVSQGLSDAGVDKLDLLGFDACLMATYEVASALAPLADRMVASQELEPGHGWDYRSLGVVAGDDAASVDADALGKSIIEGFQAQATSEGTEAEVTLALLDLTKMAEVDSAMAEFAGALAERGAAIAPVIGASRANNLGFGRSPDPAEDTQMTDLGLLAAKIGVEALDVSDQADTLIKAINDVVVHSIDGSATKGATGLSIYFPPTQELSNADYATAVGESSWLSFLVSYFNAGEAIPTNERPTFTNVDGLADATFDVDGLTLTGELDPAAVANLSEATISYGIVEADGSITYIGEEPATLPADGETTVVGTYDLTSLTISDGQDTAYAYLTMTIDEAANIATIDVPLAYYAADDVDGETYQDVLLSLTLDATTFDVINETYYVYDEKLGTYGELTADPKAIIVPERLNVDADGNETWVPTSDVGLFADLPNLVYDIVPLVSGTPLFAQLTVIDFGGNTASVTSEGSIP